MWPDRRTSIDRVFDGPAMLSHMGLHKRNFSGSENHPSKHTHVVSKAPADWAELLASFRVVLFDESPITRNQPQTQNLKPKP